MQKVLDDVGRFSDLELVGRLERLVKADRALSAELLVHLGEVEARELYRERSFSSMFDYCRSGLGMSEAEAYLRIHAARVGRKFPLVVERLGAGAVHLSAIKMLSPHLTPENHVELLERAGGMSKRHIEVLIAELAPKPDLPGRMRKMPAPRVSNELSTDAPSVAPGTTPASSELEARVAACGTAMPASGAAPLAQSADERARPHRAFDSSSLPLTPAASGSAAVPLEAAVSGSTKVPPIAAMAGSVGAKLSPLPGAPDARSSTFALQSPRPRARCTPLSPGRFKLDLTLGQEAHDALEQLVELFRHQNPSGDFASIVERALKELLERTMKRRFGQPKTVKPRATREPAAVAPDVEVNAKASECKQQSRHIPNAVRHAVHTRDAGQCTFVSPDGRRCTERGFMEVHHHNTTFARGGEATTENLRLMCRSHNRLLAEKDYGRAFMQDKIRAAKGQQSLSDAHLPRRSLGRAEQVPGKVSVSLSQTRAE